LLFSRLRTLQEDVVIGIGTSPHGFRRPDPKTLLTNGIECGDDHAFVAAESGPPKDFFILGIHFPGDAELDRAAG